MWSLALSAFADPGLATRAELGTPELGDDARFDVSADAAMVVNGDVVQGDDWEDAVGIAFGNQVGCTGTLIAPDVVLTAGHCADGITHAVVGTNDVDRGGDWIRARRVIEYPRSQSSYDVALVLLERPAQGVTPRPIAMDCVLDDHLQDGADVAVVGFGATNYSGTQNTDLKHEGFTRVQDADCSQNSIEGFSSGCNASVRPGGEIGAGGNNVDSCFGDSGGPLYLLGRGDEAWLVGVTSRGYAGVPYSAPCRYGGIYTRPDAVLDWIEDNAGPVALPLCNTAPEVRDDTVAAPEGHADVTVEFSDPERTPQGEWDLREGPRHGRATLSATGRLVYDADPGFEGRDEVTVRFDDGGNPDYPRTGTPLFDDAVITFEVVSAGGPSGGGSDDEPAQDVDGDGIVDLDSTRDAPDSDYHAIGCDQGRGTVSALGTALLLLCRRQRRTTQAAASSNPS